MRANIIYKCESCNCQIDAPGLCNECLNRHDKVVRFIAFIMWILALICFFYYYIIFIK